MLDDFDGPAGTPPSERFWTFEVGGGGWGDEQLQTYTAANAALDGDVYLLLNLAVGGSWPGNDLDERALPATMLIDWVRATVPPWPTTQR